MQKVTMSMIAQRAGVSIGTVDRALNDRGRINDDTKQNILNIAKELKYQPNKMASALSKKKKLKLAVVMPKSPNYFMDKLRQGVEEAYLELLDYGTEIEYIFSDTLDPDEQEPILRNINPNMYDGIALNAGGESLRPAIDRLVDSGMPVVAFNTDVSSSKRSFYVGENSYKNGRVAGELMGRMLEKKGEILVFLGFKDVSSHKERCKGFVDVVKEMYPEINILGIIEHHDNEEEANKKMGEILESGQIIDGIFCVSTPGVVGVGKCLREHDQHICLIGYDVNELTSCLLKEGYCSAVMFQDPQRQGFEAVALLNKMLNSEWVPKHKKYHTRTQIVLSGNIDDYADDAKENGIIV